MSHDFEEKLYQDITDVGGFAMAKAVKTWHHQELQKARHDWLREEIVKLGETKLDTSPAEGYNNPDADAHNKALQTIIDRYQSELDQCPDHYIAGHNEGYNKESCNLPPSTNEESK